MSLTCLTASTNKLSNPSAVLAFAAWLATASQKCCTAIGHHVCAANTAAARFFKICFCFVKATKSAGNILFKLGPNALTNLYSVHANFH